MTGSGMAMRRMNPTRLVGPFDRATLLPWHSSDASRRSRGAPRKRATRPAVHGDDDQQQSGVAFRRRSRLASGSSRGGQPGRMRTACPRTGRADLRPPQEPTGRMATYRSNYGAQLSDERKAALPEAIKDAHAKTTGAPRDLTQASVLGLVGMLLAARHTLRISLVHGFVWQRGAFSGRRYAAWPLRWRTPQTSNWGASW